MKKTKKLVAMLILSALIFGLMPMVSAATVFTKLPVQLKWGSSAAELEAAAASDYMVYSIDVKKKMAENLELCFGASKQQGTYVLEDTDGSGWTDPFYILLKANGDVGIKSNGSGYDAADEEDITFDEKINVDEQFHNIILRVNNTTKEADFYVNGSYCKTISCRKDDFSYPINKLLVWADKDGMQDAAEYKLDYYPVYGDLRVELENIDLAENKLIFELSEPLDMLDCVELTKDNIEIKNTNNTLVETEGIEVTDVETSGRELTVTLNKKLYLSQQYALVLPDGILGFFGGEPKSNYVYFNSGESVLKEYSTGEYEIKKFSDYTNYVNTVDVTFQQARVVDDDAIHGKSLEMVKVNGGQASYDTWNWNGQGATNAPTGSERSVISFDAKAMRSDLHMVYELAMPGDSLTNEDFNIIWDTNGNLLANVGFPSDGWTTNHGDEFGFKGTIVGTYKADEWINFRMDIDKTVSPYKVSLYINNKFINTYTNANWTNKGTETFSRFRELKYWVNSANTDPMHNTTIGSQGDALMRFDNFTAGAADDKLVSVGFTNMVYENSSNRVWELQKANGGLAVYDVAWGNSDNAPTGEGKSVISFDAKAMRGDLHMVYELAMPGDSLTNEDFNIIWDTNGNLLANVGFPSDGWTTNHGDEFGFKGTIVGTYKADEWINFRMDIDKTVSPYKVSLYINNKFINTYTNANWTNKGTETFSRFRELKYWVNSANTDPMHNTTIGSQGDALMQFDNFICIAEGEKTLNVSDVKVKMKDNSVVGPYDMVDGEVEYIEVYYNGTIAENALKNVVLKHNNTRLVPCTVTPITDKNGFKLTPVNILKAVRPITLSADATEAGAYTCNFAGGNAYVLNANIKLVDGSGNKAEQFSANTPYHVAAEIDNWTDEAKTVALYAARYEGNLLTEIVPLAPPAIAKDASFDINNATDSKLTVTPSKNDTQIKVFAFSGDNKFMPLCGAYSAFKAQ